VQGVDELVGREGELATVSSFLAGTSGEGGSLLLEGPAGIGKTSIWEAGCRLARDSGFQVLVARPTLEEERFGFAVLADLLGGLDPAILAPLPPPQRRALEAALLLGDAGDVGGARAVPAALLGTLRLLAASAPVVLAVDDVQWVDGESSRAIAYAGRRLGPAPIRLLLTRRVADRPASQLERSLDPVRVEVGPLSFGAVCRLLQQRLGLTFSRPASRRIYEASGGNALFALELARLISARGGRIAAEDDLPLPEIVETALADRLETLAPSVRDALLAAELGGNATVAELAGAVEEDAIEEGERIGVLVRRGDRVRPSHPLLGAAAKARTRPADLREMHRLLATTAADEGRAVRHLALTWREPDAELAAVVAAAAERAALRGATAEAADLGEHALRLTHASDAAWPERLLAAAGYQNVVGELERTRELLLPAVDTLSSPDLRLQAFVLLRGVGRDMRECQHYLDRAATETTSDPHLRAFTLMHLAQHRSISRVADVPGALACAEEAAELAESGDLALRLDALGALAWARHLAGRPSEDVRERRRSLGDGDTVRLYLSPERAFAVRRIWRGELDRARAELHDLLALADVRGESEAYFAFRLHLCELELRAAGWDAVEALVDEWADQREEAMGGNAALLRCRALLAAGRGLVDEARRRGAEALATAQGVGTEWQELESRRALGLTALAGGDPATAAAELAQVSRHTSNAGVGDPGAFPFAADYVEALVATGALEEAAAVASTLAAQAEQQAHPWARVAAARCRGHLLLGERSDDAAAAAFAEAAAGYERLGFRLDQGRSLLLLGTALRHARRLREGRAACEQALAVFERIDSPGWAERARAELARFGGRTSGRGLTPTEERVASLVAQGLPNKRVAAELTVSVSAVERHLTRVYRKLGVHSRSELVRLLAQA
jgi:DNA-binding NarL/FixJ family response regulator